MNNDLISRAALKKVLTEEHINMTLTFDIDTFNCVMNIIDNAPTVEERPHGKWISASSFYICGNCGIDSRYKSHFCSCCGAQMDKGGKDHDI